MGGRARESTFQISALPPKQKTSGINIFSPHQTIQVILPVSLTLSPSVSVIWIHSKSHCLYHDACSTTWSLAFIHKVPCVTLCPLEHNSCSFPSCITFFNLAWKKPLFGIKWFCGHWGATWRAVNTTLTKYPLLKLQRTSCQVVVYLHIQQTQSNSSSCFLPLKWMEDKCSCSFLPVFGLHQPKREIFGSRNDHQLVAKCVIWRCPRFPKIKFIWIWYDTQFVNMPVSKWTFTWSHVSGRFMNGSLMLTLILALLVSSTHQGKYLALPMLTREPLTLSIRAVYQKSEWIPNKKRWPWCLLAVWC